MIKMVAWMNKECGNVHFSLSEMFAEAREMYHWGETSEPVPIDTFYKPIWIEI